MTPAISPAAPGRVLGHPGFEPARQRQRRTKVVAPDVRILVPAALTMPPGLAEAEADHYAFYVGDVALAHACPHRVKDGHVNLMAVIMRDMFKSPAHYMEIRAAALASGDVVCDETYSVGVKAKGYRPGPHLEGGKMIRRPVTNKSLVKKILARRGYWTAAPEGVHRHLFGWLRKLEFDAEAALDWLSLDPDYQPSDETAVHMLSIGDLRFSVDEFGRRVHSNLTNLPTRLRPFLHYGGRELVNLDIANSQPLILGAMILDDRRGKGPVEPDVLHYVDLCERGKFYEYMMDAADILPQDGMDFKRTVFGGALFCRLPTVYVPEREQARLLRQLFPTVHAVTWAKRSGPDKDAFKELAKELQRTESAIMIDGVCKKIMAEVPHVPVWTIHDSIITTPDHADEVMTRITAEFALRGVRPKIRVEPLSRPV